MADRVGQQLGNYRLVRLLGRGGFAEVYLGEHLHLKSYAALKVLQTELSDEDVARFLVEGQTLARLTHPQIVGVHDFAVEQGTPFLVMDYAPRGTVRQQHPRGSCLSLDTVMAYVRPVSAALQYAHNRHVIHRDVKPENMLLGAQREILLSDFGIALFAPSPEMLSTQEMAGTLPYMAPEQLRGKPCFASDQYALGIVVYEWLCGVRPFEGPYWQLFNQHLSVLPPPLREKDPSLPEAVERVVLKALAKDPEQRYVSVQLFAQALERASQVRAIIPHNDSEATGPLPTISSASPVTPKWVFLSYSHADRPFVIRLQADLQKRGISVWNEHHSNISGALDQENLLRHAIRAVDVVVLVLSSHTRTSHIVREHLRIAVLYQRQLVYVWAEGEDLASLLPEAGGTPAPVDVIDAREVRYELALDELVIRLEEELPEVSTPQESSLAGTVGEPRNPYKGLRAFTENDAADFFGRETLIGELVDAVKERLRSEQLGPSPTRLLTVIGPSGSGKSSVVMAGLLPRLQQNALPKSGEWVYLSPMVPGVHPLEALALTLAPHLPDRSLKSIREDLEDDSARGLHLLASHLVKGSEKKVVLFIDQFEEAFNLTTSESERERFFALLLAAMTERKGPVLVFLTLRADFYDRLMTASELGRLIQKYQLVVWPLEENELRAAIKGPASLPDVKLTFEGNLLGDLLYEVRGQVGALPLLQFTLDQLFVRRKDRLLTQQAYQEIGGVKGALAKHAEETYLALPSQEHRQFARTLFLRLIDPGVTEQDTTRRRATRVELVLVDPVQTEILRETMDAFIRARLLTTNEVASTSTIEVSHEALIREWERLCEWLHTAREDIRRQKTISEDVTEWEQRGKPKDRLYHGSQLQEAREWAKRNIPSSNEVAFLRASVARRIRSTVGVFAIWLLIVSSISASLWLFTHRASDLPDPTLVTNLKDNGVGSLRWSIDSAPSGSTITFDKGLSGHTILLTDDLPIVRKSLNIQGPHAHHLIINSNHTIFLFSYAFIRIFDLTFTGSKSNPGPLFKNSGILSFTNSTISGNIAYGKNATTIEGSNAVDGGGIYNDGTLTITNSTISSNMSSGRGGGIANAGKLTITNSTVSSNRASFEGGGIVTYNDSTLTITNSTISDNISSPVNTSFGPYSDGGGLANGPNSKVTLTNDTISNNTSSGVGGGISNFGSSVDIKFCTISNNKTSSGGGGLSIRDYQDSNGKNILNQVNISDSTVSDNTVTSPSSMGGGIYDEGELSLANSTISNNSASIGGGGVLIQSSISDQQSPIAQANLVFSTFSNNKAPDGADIAVNDITYNVQGEPIKSSVSISQVKIESSIVGGNDVQHNPIVGVLNSGGYNVIQHMSLNNFDASPAHATDRSVDDLTGVLGPHPQLQKNGGPTQTLALLPDPQNPALNMIPLSSCQIKEIYDTNLHIYTDQRGMPRPGKNKQSCDIGAYESQH